MKYVFWLTFTDDYEHGIKLSSTVVNVHEFYQATIKFLSTIFLLFSFRLLLYHIGIIILWHMQNTKCTSPYVRPFRNCVRNSSYTPWYMFVHIHTQWPTWHEDDRKDGNWGCCKFYMSYGTFLLHIIPILMFVLAINVQLLCNA